MRNSLAALPEPAGLPVEPLGEGLGRVLVGVVDLLAAVRVERYLPLVLDRRYGALAYAEPPRDGGLRLARCESLLDLLALLGRQPVAQVGARGDLGGGR